jgi:hypothetical protein
MQCLDGALRLRSGKPQFKSGTAFFAWQWGQLYRSGIDAVERRPKSVRKNQGAVEERSIAREFHHASAKQRSSLDYVATLLPFSSRGKQQLGGQS